MSTDRPKKEKDWGEKLQEFVEDIWGTSDFAETPFNDYTEEKREKDYEKILNKMIADIAKAKTEAKIEVLEEVIGKFGRKPCSCPKGGLYDDGYGNGVTCTKCNGDEWVEMESVETKSMEEMLSNLKKEKK